MILFYLIPLYLSNAIPLENDKAGAVNVMLDRTNLGSRVSKPKCTLKRKEREDGFCVLADGTDQNSGVIKLDSLDGRTRQRIEQCLEKCNKHAGATGCELVWDNWFNKGCYVHTSTVAKGNGVANHACWICKEENYTGPPTTTGFSPTTLAPTPTPTTVAPTPAPTPGRDRLQPFGSKEKRHEEQGACEEDKLTDCDKLRDVSEVNPQGLDYCFVEGYIDRMREICFRTCGYCDPPELPECEKTPSGCCWDKKTIKLTSDGSNCPKCRDQYKNACTTFKEDCTSRYKPGEFMIEYCPATCGLCDGKCMDDRKYRTLCSFWKTEFGWCDSKDGHFDIMRVFCPATCELC